VGLPPLFPRTGSQRKGRGKPPFPTCDPSHSTVIFTHHASRFKHHVARIKHHVARITFDLAFAIG
jgi:hypothetical protein